MVNDLAKICSKAQSSSSSSTGPFCENKNNGFSPCGCNRCCSNPAINDHTYTLLKRICRKIIKNYNRQQCREKYTIFDGGNSINLRIHRGSSFFGQDGTKYPDCADAFGSRDNKRRSDQFNVNLPESKNVKKAGESKGKTGGKTDNQIGGKGRKGSQKPDSTEKGDSKDKKQKSKAKDGDKGSKKDVKEGSHKPDSTEKGDSKDKKQKSKSTDGTDDKGLKQDVKAGSHKPEITEKGDSKDKKEKSKGIGGSDDKGLKQSGKAEAKDRLKGDKNRRSTKDGDETGKKRSKSRSKGDKSRRSSIDEKVQKRSSRKKRKSKDDNGEKRLKKSTKDEGSRASKKSKSDYRRDSSKGRNLSRNQKLQPCGSEKSRTTIGRPSRADEVRPCDVLRAQLEQRDFARSCGDPCQPCYPCRICVPCQSSCVHNNCQKYVC